MSSKFGTLIEAVEVPSPSLDRTERCLDDQRLRAAGFQILGRPKVGPAIWIKGGVEFTFKEAMLRLKALKGGL